MATTQSSRRLCPSRRRVPLRRRAPDFASSGTPVRTRTGGLRATLAGRIRQPVNRLPVGVEILIADDEPGVRESLAEVLRDAGYEVETASDGSAAPAIIEAKDFAVVVTDIRMPGADGLAVLRRAREVSPQTVVMVMTAHASIETAVEALRAGAADYVLKPVLFDDLLARSNGSSSTASWSGRRRCCAARSSSTSTSIWWARARRCARSEALGKVSRRRRARC